ncbi:LysE family translocator [Pantoea allii]|uniref:Threonine/homoserine/homoserine lactone efflux protein n=1 Tax=Pantoea allii TaxID=574096 RepID=A0A2V2BGZ5_9GAMM|nr:MULTISPECIES: LysE family translocator [Pantoea]MCH9297985.1 LysE family translocator [Pantoea allii]MDJ0091488.1 LysE family translocator [Pantoea allii]NQS85178.1 LysE family translocator [Pantoea allii]PWK96760.1 threonine/homoserine/homoserine lactone efflux protein [Pantoea allii]
MPVNAELLPYVLALGLAAAIPGPGMTAIVARSLNGGSLAGLAALVGVIMGDLFYLTLAVFGLGVVAHTYTALFTLINWAAALYLGFLAWQFWSYQPHAINIDQKVTRQQLASAWLSGLSITLGNPKTIAFYLAILPLVISLETISLKFWGTVLVPVTAAVLLAVGAMFILAAMKIRVFLTSPQSLQIMYKVVGVIMLLAAIGMIVKTL